VYAAAPIDFGHPILDESGKPAKDPLSSSADSKNDPNCDKCELLTLGLAGAHALMAQLPDERDLDPMQKWARGSLAMKLKANQPLVLSAAEVNLLKTLMGKVYGSLVIMQAFPLLDPGVEPPAIK
jgi:hypothetical protein